LFMPTPPPAVAPAGIRRADTVTTASIRLWLLSVVRTTTAGLLPLPGIPPAPSASGSRRTRLAGRTGSLYHGLGITPLSCANVPYLLPLEHIFAHPLTPIHLSCCAARRSKRFGPVYSAETNIMLAIPRCIPLPLLRFVPHCVRAAPRLRPSRISCRTRALQDWFVASWLARTTLHLRGRCACLFLVTTIPLDTALRGMPCVNFWRRSPTWRTPTPIPPFADVVPRSYLPAYIYCTRGISVRPPPFTRARAWRHFCGFRLTQPFLPPPNAAPPFTRRT